MKQISLLIRRYGFDALVVLAAILGVLEVVQRSELAVSSGPRLWLATSAVALIVLLLLGFRRFPFAAPALFWVLAAGMSFIDARLITSTVTVFIAGMATAFLLGKLPDSVQARVGLALVVGGALIIVYNNPVNSTGQFVFIPIEFAMAWLAGFALRQRAAQAEAAEERAAFAERERDAAARVAVAEERARIARELHDVVAHAVSVMVLQVGAVRHKLPKELAEDRQALNGVEQTGRQALTEMRRLLGAMRSDGDDPELAPQPGLEDLGSLLTHVDRAGLPVRLHVDGDPVPLPRAIDLSAFRIVQEGLTNSLKHAHASHADVTIQYGSDDVQIEVRDDGEGGATTGGPGYGLLGVRERVKIYGGEMTAGSDAQGGFVLRARLPIGGDRL
jgi:signal transduction histidine kinase